MARYMLQGSNKGSSCGLISLINCCKYLGLPTPKFGSDEWERLVDVIGCRHGSAISVDDAATELGLKRKEIRVGPKTIAKNLPVIIIMANPHRGMYLHSVAVVGGDVQLGFELVNYRWLSGPVKETMYWQQINMEMLLPGHSNREAWAVSRMTH